MNELDNELLVKLFRAAFTYCSLYESFFISIHDEIVSRANTLSSMEFELIKQPILLKRDLFFESPLLKIFEQ